MRLFKKALKRYKIDMLTANEEAGTSRRNSTLLKALTFHDIMQQAEVLDNSDDDDETRKRIFLDKHLKITSTNIQNLSRLINKK